MKINVGIDLGTTYSAVATFSRETGKVEILKNSMGSFCTPSVVCFSNGKILIGDDAKEEQKFGNVNSVAFYKSMMGEENWNAYINNNEYSAEELSSIFLSELKKDIENTNNIKIDSAVITVPAYFNERQREATIRAAKKSGLNVLKIINEPTSAIIAYGLLDGKDKNVLVYDLGGGTFDVTIAHVSGTKIDVLATNGNHQLGGKDWDNILLDDIKEKFYTEHSVLIDNFPEELNELQVKCEEAKKKLSTSPSSVVTFQCDGITGKYTITKEEFNYKTSSLLDETLSLITRSFEEISLSTNKKFDWRNIDEVVLVGGSTRMPQVKEMIIKEYGKHPVTKDINVDTIVAVGAAMQAELCVSNKITLTLVDKSKIENSFNKPSFSTLTISNSDIQDITAHGLGMLAKDSSGKDYINSTIIPKNSKINKNFQRLYDFIGDKLDVYVLQGESRDPFDTEIIGAYSITGMTPGKKNKISVDFLYNSNGVVEVSATEDNSTKLKVTKEKTILSISEIIKKLKEEELSIINKNENIEVILCIDTSGSMSGIPIMEAKKAAKVFVNDLSQISAKISIVSFADEYLFLCESEVNLKNINIAIDKIKVGQVGGSNFSTPIKSTRKCFKCKQNKILVILTDGFWVFQEEELKESKLAKEDGIVIYAIGFGDADKEFLEAISSGKGIKVDLSELKEAFKEVASSIATEVNNSISK